MAYKNFSIEDLEKRFGVSVELSNFEDVTNVRPIAPSEQLRNSLGDAALIALTSEKSISERIIAPVLSEMKRLNPDVLQIFSGEVINADAALGLNGEIDFIFVKKPRAVEPDAPIIAVTESKIGRLDKAIPQAAAQMIGAQLFNAKRDEPIFIIHGIITDGTTWRFLRLTDKLIQIEHTRYSLTDLPTLLGMLQRVVDFYI